MNFRNIVVFTLPLLLACNVIQSEEELLQSAEKALRQEIKQEYELEGAAVFQNMQPSKGEGEELVGIICGQFIDSGVPEDEQDPTRVIYMALDDTVLIEILVDEIAFASNAEEMKALDEFDREFKSFWKDSCS